MPRAARTTPRKKPSQERSQATVDVILRATARVLVDTGYDRASTNRIAAAAGVSIGSLYQYFPSKEALVAALVEKHTEEMTTLLRAKFFELHDAELRVAAREIVGAMLEAHMIDPKLHKVLMEQVPRVGRLERVLGVEREITALVAAFLASRRRDLRCRDLDVAAFMLVSTVEAVTHSAVLQSGRGIARSVIADELTDLVMRYLCD